MHTVIKLDVQFADFIGIELSSLDPDIHDSKARCLPTLHTTHSSHRSFKVKVKVSLFVT